MVVRHGGSNLPASSSLDHIFGISHLSSVPSCRSNVVGAPLVFREGESSSGFLEINRKKDEVDLEKIDDQPNNCSAWSNRSPIKIVHADVDFVMTDDGLAIKLHAQNEMVNTKRLRNALVVKVFGYNIPFHLISSELRKQWKQYGQFHISILGLGWIICSFQSAESVESILSGGPWIASKVGLPLMIDGNTFQWGRREFARDSLVQEVLKPIIEELVFDPSLYKNSVDSEPVEQMDVSIDLGIENQHLSESLTDMIKDVSSNSAVVVVDVDVVTEVVD
ncbi:hypothetical protein M5K25_018554 [Dendrobium thyrsiflorum]|uniref:DUF4283 domain-containing protein n=1 Tax=Dendrobium thyrsiflorum TaxID=117978 RepID=A0ABD0UIB9_DENTH